MSVMDQKPNNTYKIMHKYAFPAEFTPPSQVIPCLEFLRLFVPSVTIFSVLSSVRWILGKSIEVNCSKSLVGSLIMLFRTYFAACTT